MWGLERGIGNPSLDTLWSLAKVVKVPLGAFFVEARDDGAADIRRFAEAPIVGQNADGFVAPLLIGFPGSGEIEVSVVDLADGARRESKGNAADLIERLVCTDGSAEIGTSARSAVLWAGNLITFPAGQPHYFQAIGGPARLIAIQQYSPVGG